MSGLIRDFGAGGGAEEEDAGAVDFFLVVDRVVVADFLELALVVEDLTGDVEFIAFAIEGEAISEKVEFPVALFELAMLENPAAESFEMLEICARAGGDVERELPRGGGGDVVERFVLEWFGGEFVSQKKFLLA